MYVSSDQKDWDNHLAAILFAHRVSAHDATSESPFFLLYGREPRLLVDVSLLPARNESNSITNIHDASYYRTSTRHCSQKHSACSAKDERDL